MAEKQPGAGPAHFPLQRKGEEMVRGRGKEPGRKEAGRTHKDRPAGKSGARDSTSINPQMEEPIMPEMPILPPA